MEGDGGGVKSRTQRAFSPDILCIQLARSHIVTAGVTVAVGWTTKNSIVWVRSGAKGTHLLEFH